MGFLTALSPDFWTFVMYTLAVLILVVGMVGLSYILGQRHSEKATGEPYESGIVSTGTARIRYDFNFYRNAMFFVIFDLEAVFIVAWAIVARQTGWPGYVEIMVFIGVLLVSLIYLSRRGALDWKTAKSSQSSTTKKEG